MAPYHSFGSPFIIDVVELEFKSGLVLFDRLNLETEVVNIFF